MIKNLPVNIGDEGLIPGLGRSPGEGHGILAWEIPWTEEPSRLQNTGHRRAGHDLVTKQQQHAQNYCNKTPNFML